MKKLTPQNLEMIQKWTREMANDLAAQEMQIVERLNEQRVNHQVETAALHETISSLQKTVDSLTIEVQTYVTKDAAQSQELNKIKSDATAAVAKLKRDISTLEKENVKQIRELQLEVTQLKSDQSNIHTELKNQIGRVIELSNENEEIEALLNQTSAELASKSIEVNETQQWIAHMNQVNQKLEKQFSEEQVKVTQLKVKLSESYQKILQEQARNLAFTEKMKRSEKNSSEIPREAIEAIEASQKLKALVEEERQVFDRVTQELNRRIAKLEAERETAFQLIEEVKSVSTVEELSERLKAFESNLS